MDYIRNFFQGIYNIIVPPPVDPQPITVPSGLYQRSFNFERERMEYTEQYNLHEHSPEMVIIDMVIHNLRERNRDFRNKNNKTEFIINNLPIFSLDKKTVEEEKPVCSICLEELEIDNTVLELPCQHYFCFGKSEDSCPGIIPWLKTNMSCPICRDEITLDGFEM